MLRSSFHTYKEKTVESPKKKTVKEKEEATYGDSVEAISGSVHKESPSTDYPRP